MIESEDLQLKQPAATRLGHVLIEAQNTLSEAITFEAGCLAITPMFAGMMQIDSLLLTIEAIVPAMTLRIVLRPGHELTLFDSREGEIDTPILTEFVPDPAWHHTFPDRFHLNIRVPAGVAPEVGNLLPIATLILPFFELVRHADHLSRAISLLDAALEAVSAQEADSVPRHIMRRVGWAIDAVAGFFPAEEGRMPNELQLQSVVSATHDEALVTQIFQQFGQMPGGPVQRVFASPLRAAPVTMKSLNSNDDNEHLAELLQQMPVSDFIAQRVIHQNRVIGVLVVLATTLPGEPPNRTFTGDEIATIQSLAVVAGWALPLASEYSRLRRSLQQSEMLRHVAISSFQIPDLNQRVSLASSIAKTVLGADYVAVAMIAEDWSSSEWVFVQGNRTESHLQREMHRAAGNQRDWFQRPSWYVLQDIAKDINVESSGQLIHRAEGLVSSISVSFLAPAAGFGFLLIGFRHRRPIEDIDVEFAQSLAQTVAAVL